MLSKLSDRWVATYVVIIVVLGYVHHGFVVLWEGFLRDVQVVYWDPSGWRSVLANLFVRFNVSLTSHHDRPVHQSSLSNAAFTEKCFTEI